MGLIGRAKDSAVKLAAKVFISQLRKSEYGPMFGKIVSALDGKKTALGLLLLYAPDILQKIGEILVAFDLMTPQGVAGALGAVLTVIGAAHKGIKLLESLGIFKKSE